MAARRPAVDPLSGLTLPRWSAQTYATMAATVVLVASVLYAGHAVDLLINRTIEDDAAGQTPGLETYKVHFPIMLADMSISSSLWDRDMSGKWEYAYPTAGHLNFQRMLDGNIGIAVMKITSTLPLWPSDTGNGNSTGSLGLLSLVNRWPPSTWFSPRARALQQLSSLKRQSDQFKKNRIHYMVSKMYLAEYIDHLRPSALNYDAMERHVHTKDKAIGTDMRGVDTVGLILALDGADALEGSLTHLEQFQKRGVRMISIVHWADNAFGGSAHGTSGTGLSALGRDLVKAMEALNITVDVAHGTTQLVNDVLDIATRPVVCSHCTLAALAPDAAAALDDATAKRLAAAGGVIGIGFSGYYAGTGVPSIMNAAEAIQRAVDVVGIDAVGVSSGFDSGEMLSFTADNYIKLTRALLDDAGFNPKTLAKVYGENFLRVMRANLRRGTKPDMTPPRDGRWTDGLPKEYFALIDKDEL